MTDQSCSRRGRRLGQGLGAKGWIALLQGWLVVARRLGHGSLKQMFGDMGAQSLGRFFNHGRVHLVAD